MKTAIQRLRLDIVTVPWFAVRSWCRHIFLHFLIYISCACIFACVVIYQFHTMFLTRPFDRFQVGLYGIAHIWWPAFTFRLDSMQSKGQLDWQARNPLILAFYVWMDLTHFLTHFGENSLVLKYYLIWVGFGMIEIVFLKPYLGP